MNFSEILKYLPQLSLQTFWQLVGKGATAISTIIILGLILRNYGEVGTGLYTLTLVYLSFFFLATDLGLNSIILPKLKLNPEEAAKLFSLRILWSVILLILANNISLILPFSTPEFIMATRVGSLAILFSAVSTTTTLIFQYNLNFAKAALGTTLAAVYSLIIAIYLVTSQAKVEFLILAPTLGWLINALVGFILARRLVKLTFMPVSIGYIQKIVALGWPISATLLVNLLYFRLDGFILASVKGLAETGVYNLSYQIFQTILVIPVFIMNAYYPILVRIYTEEKERFWSFSAKSAIGMFFGGFLATLLTLALSPLIFLILTGKESESTQVLNMLSLSFPAFFATAVLMWVMIVKGLQKQMFVVYLITFLVNGLLNLIFIPHYSYIAASSITVISEYLILILLCFTLIKSRFSKQ